MLFATGRTGESKGFIQTSGQGFNLQFRDNICFELHCVLTPSATPFGDGALKEVTKVRRGRTEEALSGRPGGVLTGRGTDPGDLALLHAQRAGRGDPAGRWLTAGREDRLRQRPGLTAPRSWASGAASGTARTYTFVV